MFGLLHYSKKSAMIQATTTVQAQCAQGDREADKAAADAQHRADMNALADLQAQLAKAQQAAADATAAGDKARAKAASLAASLSALSKTDSSVERWANEPLPPSLRAAIQEQSNAQH